MAGTAVSFGQQADIANRYMTRYVLTEITDNLRDLVTDIEVLRVELNTAEDWILEVNTDLETKISATVASFNAADNADGVGEAIGTATTTGAIGRAGGMSRRAGGRAASRSNSLEISLI